jgi:N-acetylneuraminic acid mutarotase
MTELSVFERRLTAGLEEYAGPRRGVDAIAIVHSAASREPVRSSVLSGFSALIRQGAGVRGRRPGEVGTGRSARPFAALFVIALITAFAVGALAVGSGLLRLPSIVPPVVPTLPPPTSTPAPAATQSAAAWISTGEMSIGRYLQTATVLPDGSVLVAGGRSDDASGPGHSSASAEKYDPTRGTWTASANMANRRSAHTATLLPDGRVLVVGGYDDWAALDSAELYDPASGSWTATGKLIEARGYHTASLLPDGRVLVAGGRTNNSSTGRALASAEVYDPVTGSWSATGNMLAAHTFHAATLLPDGSVLVTGASYRGYGLVAAASAELYDPSTGSWTAAGQMIVAGAYQTAALLRDGRVLVAGGAEVVLDGCCAVIGQATASAELYDPSTRSWTGTGSMTEARTYHTSTILPDGEVLVTGGDRSAGGGTSTYSTDGGSASAELYDPTSGSWRTTVDLVGRRELHVAVLLRTNQVLVAGGSSAGQALRNAELYETK